MTALVRAESAGERLSEDELLTTAALVFAAGFETTTHLLGNALVALLDHPEQLDGLRRDPRRAADAVEELLRFDSPVQITGRTVLADTEACGLPMAAGQRVVAYLGAANRDPARFPDPDRLDLARADNAPLSFGGGIHYCLGAALARLEARPRSRCRLCLSGFRGSPSAAPCSAATASPRAVTCRCRYPWPDMSPQARPEPWLCDASPAGLLGRRCRTAGSAQPEAPAVPRVRTCRETIPGGQRCRRDGDRPLQRSWGGGGCWPGVATTRPAAWSSPHPASTHRRPKSAEAGGHRRGGNAVHPGSSRGTSLREELQDLLVEPVGIDRRDGVVGGVGPASGARVRQGPPRVACRLAAVERLGVARRAARARRP